LYRQKKTLATYSAQSALADFLFWRTALQISAALLSATLLSATLGLMRIPAVGMALSPPRGAYARPSFSCRNASAILFHSCQCRL